jgi:NAD(P)-dependent dehydrogenase (short-subunit alcohol dehydrogenase family)
MLKDAAAVITGAGSGIGEAIAKEFAQQGAKIVIADWDETEGHRVEKHLIDGGCSALFVRTDVSKSNEVQALVNKSLNRFGKIDIVVNNAATILPKLLEDVEEDEWHRLLDVNLKSVYLMIKHTIQELRKTRGSIVNMSSLGGLTGQKHNAAYASTKGAIIAMTKSLALDYAPDGVRVNCICPVGVQTPLLEKWITDQADPNHTEV